MTEPAGETTGQPGAEGARGGLWRGVLARMAAGAFWAALAAFIPLAQYTAAAFLWKDSPISLQPVPEDGAPIPAALLWHPRTYRILTAIAGFPMPGILVVYIGLAAAGAYIIVRILNPTFRVTTGVDWDRWILLKTYMHTAPLIKVIVTIVPVQVAVFLLWLVVQAAIPSGVAISVVTAFLVGASWWLALSRNGFVGDCDSGNYLLPSRREAVSLVVRGGVFGIVVWLLFYAVLAVQPLALLRLARSLGGVGEGGWRPIAIVWLGMAAFAGAAAVLAAVGLGTPSAHRKTRVGATVGGLLATLALVTAAHRWIPSYAAYRFDYAWRTGQLIKPAWWKPDGNEHAEVIWIGAPVRGEWKVRRVAGAGASEVELSEENIGRICRLLGRREYCSALAVSGFMALYDDACRRMDLEDRLTIAGEALRRTGDPLFARVLLADLWELAGSREAANATDILRDGRAFAYLTEDARVPAGDACARNHRLAEALRWYREAGLPNERAEERASRLAVFVDGRVRGRVRVRGNVESVRVALVPAEAEVVTMLAGSQPSEIGPFALRAVVRSAELDQSGRYVMRHVADGRYVLLVRIAGSSALAGRHVTIAGERAATEPFGVTVAAPDVDLGTVDITVE